MDSFLAHFLQYASPPQLYFAGVVQLSLQHVAGVVLAISRTFHSLMHLPSRTQTARFFVPTSKLASILLEMPII